MRFEPFHMERWQSLHENEVELNLSDSGVHPLTLRELLDPAELEAVLDERLIYTQTNGTPELRRLVASLYPGATEDCVQIVNGGAEANFLSLWSLVSPGDEVVVGLPNYMQAPGLVEAFGGVCRPWSLVPDFERRCWRADLQELERLVTPKTRMIAICNPNNPTGARLSADELDAICAIADKHGAWVLADEIYRGSDLDGGETPSLWGRTERAIVTSSLSKTWGLPGLRLGWIVAPPEQARETWEYHDYTTIAPNALSDFVACRALQPARQARLLERARELLTTNYAVVSSWLQEHTDTLTHIAPRAGAMLYLRYTQPIGSSELATRLLREKSVLVVPGDHFGMDGWLRIGFGGETDTVRRGLERVADLLGSLPD